MTTKYIIVTEEDGERLFWCNEDGWTYRLDATRFTQEERDTLNLPMGGSWEPDVMELTDEDLAKLQFTSAWCSCLEGTLDDEFHVNWPLDFEDGPPLHYCPMCLKESEGLVDADYHFLRYDEDGKCPRGHQPPRKKEDA